MVAKLRAARTVDLHAVLDLALVERLDGADLIHVEYRMRDLRHIHARSLVEIMYRKRPAA